MPDFIGQMGQRRQGLPSDSDGTEGPADRDLVDPSSAGRGGGHASQLLAHVPLLQRFDRVPVQVQLLGYILDRRHPAPTPHEECKPLVVEGIVGQPLRPLALHCPAAPARHPAYLHVQVNARVAARQVPHQPSPSVVETALPLSTGARRRFFRRRTSTTIRASDRQTPHALLPAGATRRSDTRPATVAVCPSPNHAKFSARLETLNPLCRAAFQCQPHHFLHWTCRRP